MRHWRRSNEVIGQIIGCKRVARPHFERDNATRYGCFQVEKRIETLLHGIVFAPVKGADAREIGIEHQLVGKASEIVNHVVGTGRKRVARY